MHSGATMLPTRPTVLPLPTASDLETERIRTAAGTEDRDIEETAAQVPVHPPHRE